MAALAPKQQRFVEEYLVDLNATQAAIRAGYSPKTAEQQGARLLGNAKVAEAVQAAQAIRSERTLISADRVVEELACMAFFDPADLVRQPVKKPEDIALLPENVRRVIAGWSWDKQGNFVLKLTPKTPNIELIGRHLGMWNDKLELSGEVKVKAMSDEDLAARIAELTARGKKGGGA